MIEKYNYLARRKLINDNEPPSTSSPPPPLCSSGESRLFPKSYLIVFLNLQSFHPLQLENICNIL